MSDAVIDYSMNAHNAPLCIEGQRLMDHLNKDGSNSKEQLLLFLRLKHLGANPILNKKDAYKTVDIAIEDIGLHLEIDGTHHNWKATQAYSDLQRTIHDLEIGITTIRIPNSLVWHNFTKCTDQLIRFIEKKRGFHQYDFGS